MDIINKQSSNFGGGIELLMNDKKKNNTTTSIDLDIGELSNLENELNNLSEDINITEKIDNKITEDKNTINNPLDKVLNVQFKENISNNKDTTDINKTTNLGESTSNAFNKSTTWDGYGKLNNNIVEKTNEKQYTNEELVREKFSYLRKLEELERKGANLTKRYTMESSLLEMQGEYEMIISEKERQNSVKFQGKMLMAAITGIEFLNSKFDPFDIKIDGWGEQINENINDYDEIFAELHEKYKSKAKIAPELKLLFQLGSSAIMVHMTNTMFKSTIPGMDDIMKQNPELMQQLNQAAVNSMSDKNPGFSNFMNNFIPGNSFADTQPSVSNMGSLPPSINTQVNKSERNLPPKNRPDLTSSNMGEGISIEENYSNFNSNERINLSNNTNRADMKGPSDINNLLSGLKNKNNNTNTNSNSNNNDNSDEIKETSTISIQELKELSQDKLPKPVRKQKNSREKNTVSLDF